MKKLCTKLAIFLFVLVSWTDVTSLEFSNNPHTKVGKGATLASPNASVVINLWQTIDPSSGLSKIQGTWAPIGSSPGTPVDLTSNSLHSTNPSLAVPSGKIGLTGTQGFAAWKTYDVLNDVFTVQGTIVSQLVSHTEPVWHTASNTSGAFPKNLSVTNGDEIPMDDLQVDISADGNLISVVWTAYNVNTGETVIKFTSSSNGGNTFSTAVNL